MRATLARRRRLFIVAFVCVWGAVWARAFQLQILSGDTLEAVGGEQSRREVTVTAPRGEIFDRNGRLLAINVARRSYFAYPNRETGVKTLAARFASVRRESTGNLQRAWSRRSDKFTWMARRCDEETASRIDRWNLRGVYPTWEYDRAYPMTIAGVGDPLGFVNADLFGAAGLECYYDALLRGDDGRGIFLADAVGRRFTIDPVAGRKPRAGRNLQMTIDARWQSILAEELAAAVSKWKANWGVALLMDPYTGAVIAMADIDPAGKSYRAPKSRLVSDVFEPGSTFKIVSYAAALSDGVVYPGEYFDGGDGVGVFSGRTIRDDKKHAILSAAEAFHVSSNVVTGKIANRLEPGRLDYWARKLGFGEPTGIDLPGESGGHIAQQRHSDFNVATRAIGHGISTTPIQLAVAAAAIANGGYRVRPHLLAAAQNQEGDWELTETRAERVIRPEVSSVMRHFMRDVVTSGTAEQIADPRFPIAGKTGTAEKPNPATGRYDKNRFIASFVGFYPADKPRLVGVIVLDEPEPIHYGGYTAAPVLLNTVRRAAAGGQTPSEDARFYGAGRRVAESSGTSWSRQLVDWVVPWLGASSAHAAIQSDPYEFVADEQSREQSSPAAGVTGWERIASTARVTTPATEGASSAAWPDLQGLSLRDALTILRARGVQARFTGSGAVIAQSPAAGTPIGDDRQCRLTLQ